MRIFFIALFAALTVVSAAAGEEPVELKKAPGVDRVEANCGACHSLDYIPMNSPFLNAAGWDAEVAKMINAFGAPIDQADAKIIADYLKNNYGTIQTNEAGGAAAKSSLALDSQSKKASMGGYKREGGTTRVKHVTGKRPAVKTPAVAKATHRAKFLRVCSSRSTPHPR
jgi:hypothetical protein